MRSNGVANLMETKKICLKTIIVQIPRVSEHREMESWNHAVKSEGFNSGSQNQVVLFPSSSLWSH